MTEGMNRLFRKERFFDAYVSLCLRAAWSLNNILGRKNTLPTKKRFNILPNSLPQGKGHFRILEVFCSSRECGMLSVFELRRFRILFLARRCDEHRNEETEKTKLSIFSPGLPCFRWWEVQESACLSITCCHNHIGSKVKC